MNISIARDLARRAFRLSFGEKDERLRAFGIIENVRKHCCQEDEEIKFLRRLVIENVESLVYQKWEDDEEEEEEEQKTEKTEEKSNEKPIQLTYCDWELDWQEEEIVWDDREYLPPPIELANKELEVNWEEVQRYRKWIRGGRKRLPETLEAAVASMIENHPQEFGYPLDEYAWQIYRRRIDPLKSPEDITVDLKIELAKMENEVLEAQKPDEWAKALEKAGVKPELHMLRSASKEYLYGMLNSLHEPDLAKAGYLAWLSAYKPGWNNYNRILKETKDEKQAFKAWAQTMVLKRISDRKCYLEHPATGKSEVIDLPLCVWRSKRNLIAVSDIERAKKYGIQGVRYE